MSRPIEELRAMFAGKRSLHASYQRLFSGPDGKAVLGHLAKTFHVTRPTFVRGDPHMTSYSEGQRSVVLAILKFVNKDPDKLLQELEKGIEDETT